MKFKLFSFLILGIILFMNYSQVRAQQMEYTPYEDVPSIEKILKPTYNENMPEWGKMLYQYPVNFTEINRLYSIWESENPNLKTPLSRYFKLWRKNLAPYVLGDGSIYIPDFNAINERAQQEQSNNSKIQAISNEGNTSDWTFLGPKQTFWLSSGSSSVQKAASWQANVYSFDVTETNPDVLFCGTETGFVNKTIDKGETWNISGLNYVFGGGVTAIAIDPTNIDIVYVSAGNAIHRTINGGDSWGRINSGFSANRVKIDYSNTKKLIASTDKGVYITENRGSAWSQKSSYSCWDIEFKPNSSDTIYALTQSASKYFQIIQSNDGGNTFNKISTFPTNIPQESGGLLAVTPANPNILWAIMLSKESDVAKPFIYKGTLANGEWSWVKTYTGYTGLSSSSGITNGQGYFDLVLEASPVNENILFAGTTSLYKSQDGGVTFDAIGGYKGSFSIHPDIQDMKILPNGDTWVATDGGMNYSSDGFVSSSNWGSYTNGIIGSDMWGFDQGWNEDLIVGGRYHNGNTAIADFYGDKALRLGGGESPTGWLLKGKSRHAAFNDLGNGYILPLTAESPTQGRFVFSKYPNMEQYGAYRTEVLTHPYYSATLFVGSDAQMWKSTDYGVNYDLLYTFPGNIRYVNISSANPDVMYADIVSNGFYRTEDGGMTWKKMDSKSSPGWIGEMTFAISPYDANVLYAAEQVGAWGTFDSEVYKSTDGGNNWTKISDFGKSVKSIVVQPTSDEKDLIYAVTTSVNSTSAKVYYKKDGDDDWTLFDSNYPSGMNLQVAKAFFRDSKLRAAGSGGVWESPLAEPEFTPVLVPWVEKSSYSCNARDIKLDDHSILNHEGASWNWEITPEPATISDPNIRNPVISVDKPGKYSVKMSVTRNEITYTKTFNDLFEVEGCPSIYDCSNPAKVPKDIWSLISVDSYYLFLKGDKVFDGETSTIWHSAKTEQPHEIILDLGNSYSITKMIHTPRSASEDGRIKDYELYITEDTSDWGSAFTGEFENTSNETTVEFDAKIGRYVKLVALSEVNGENYTTLAELDFVGCRLNTGTENIENERKVNIFPIPSNSTINISLPFNDGIKTYVYSVYSASGKQMKSATVDKNAKELNINVMDYKLGYYIVNIEDNSGISYKAKFIKQ